MRLMLLNRNQKWWYVGGTKKVTFCPTKKGRTKFSMDLSLCKRRDSHSRIFTKYSIWNLFKSCPVLQMQHKHFTPQTTFSTWLNIVNASYELVSFRTYITGLGVMGMQTTISRESSCQEGKEKREKIYIQLTNLNLGIRWSKVLGLQKKEIPVHGGDDTNDRLYKHM